MKGGFVYIMSNKSRSTFYIGVTSNLKTRIADHKNGIGSEFTKKNNLNNLLYFEDFPDIYQAIDREKQLKNWHRQWKINLIQSVNPEMNDLYWEIRYIIQGCRNEFGMTYNIYNVILNLIRNLFKISKNGC